MQPAPSAPQTGPPGPAIGGHTVYGDRVDDRILASFLTDDGRLHTLPTKRAKLLVVLDHLAQAFDPGRVYREEEVNEVLQRFHPDHAALRRYLVEDQFLARKDSRYWRSGTLDA